MFRFTERQRLVHRRASQGRSLIQKSPIPSGEGKIDENKFERCEIV